MFTVKECGGVLGRTLKGVSNSGVEYVGSGSIVLRHAITLSALFSRRREMYRMSDDRSRALRILSSSKNSRGSSSSGDSEQKVSRSRLMDT